MRVSLLQMDMAFMEPDTNFSKAEALIREAALQKPDVVVLPETWNTGFYPREGLEALADPEGRRTRALMGELSCKLNLNIVAGSVACLRGDKVYNTALVFDRSGGVIATYDKTHLFSYMGEDSCFTPGSDMVTFELDGVKCGIVTCYDIRFVELVRGLGLKGIEVLFVVSQWPVPRLDHWQTLNRARAIENQFFVCCCNSCGRADETQYAGHSMIIDPWGQVLVGAGPQEVIATADLDMAQIGQIRSSLHVYRDRRTDLYKLETSL